MKVIFMGGKLLGPLCLKEIVKHNNFNIELVIVNSDDRGKDASWYPSTLKIAKKLGLRTIKFKNINNPVFIKKIKKISPDVIFCIFFEQIIKEEILSVPKLGCINMHYALLPKYRGRFSTMYAIFNGDKKSGVTIHWMDKGIDSGDIIKQKAVPIYDADTAKDLYLRCTKTGFSMFKSLLKDFIKDKKIPRIPQQHEKATYCSKKLPNNGEIDWRWSGKKIYNFIRAMTFEPFEPPCFYLKRKKMVVSYIKSSKE